MSVCCPGDLGVRCDPIRTPSMLMPMMEPACPWLAVPLRRSRSSRPMPTPMMVRVRVFSITSILPGDEVSSPTVDGGRQGYYGHHNAANNQQRLPVDKEAATIAAIFGRRRGIRRHPKAKQFGIVGPERPQLRGHHDVVAWSPGGHDVQPDLGAEKVGPLLHWAENNLPWKGRRGDSEPHNIATDGPQLCEQGDRFIGQD